MDVTNMHIPRHIDHVLRHTSHEPIERVFVVEEHWPKQYNVPDRLWDSFYDEPADKISYYNLRAICTDSGQLISSRPGWIYRQTLLSISDNPRLENAMRQANPFYSTFLNPRVHQAGNSAYRTAQSFDLNTN